MDEEAERQLTASTHQLQGGSRPTSPSGAGQRRSLASILSIKREPRRPKTPSVVVTDETTHLSELTSIPSGRLAGKSKLSVRSSSCSGVVNGGTLESIVALDTEPAGPATLAAPGAANSSAIGEAAAAASGAAPAGATSLTPPTPVAVVRPSVVRRCCQERVRKSIWGVLIMVSVSAAWVGATHLLKWTFRSVHVVVVDESDNRTRPSSAPSTAPSSSVASEMPSEWYTYDASFFTTWLVTTWTALFLPLYAVCCLVSGRFGPRKLVSELRDSIFAFRDKGFTIGTFVGRCCLFCLLWVGTNWMYVYALSVLDATDVMALFATNVSFVYLLSWVVLHDQFVGLRIVAVILCNTGIALLAYMDGITRSPTLGGVMLAATASAGSAVYKVSFKRIFGEATYGQVSFFFSLIGLLNAVLLWPIVLMLHFTGVEVLDCNRAPWDYLLIAGALSLFANLLGNFGPAVTYEVFIHLGLMLAIPISAVLDAYVNHVVFEGMKLAGTIMIINGFILVLLPENWPDYLTRLLRWGRHLNHHNQPQPPAAPVDLRTGYISRSHLRSPSGRVR